MAYDVALVGAGIMSATLAAFLKELQPDLKIIVLERLDRVAGESSDAWNNAGTGHSAFCELNYTPEKPDGSIDLSKASKIAQSFECSLQFWAYLVSNGYFQNPADFIHRVPHCSLVWGEEDRDFLKKRWQALQNNPLFQGMEYTEDRSKISDWMPLISVEQPQNAVLTATQMSIGTDVNFGALTRGIFAHLQRNKELDLRLQVEVEHLEKLENSNWLLEVEDKTKEENYTIEAKFVFLGAGGAALTLLDKSDIEEGRGYGGFPVSGQWLVCQNQDIIEQHHAKVYGKASVGAPPMSVPHLDTRIIDGKKALLFGPFAGFTTKFLREGSIFDLPFSIDFDNMPAMLGAWMHNMPLTKYLIEQVTQSESDRLEALRVFLPQAVAADWKLVAAGQRVQVIKKHPEYWGVLEFGTEVVTAVDGKLAALLGASPGASTAAVIMLQVLERCMPKRLSTEKWQKKLAEMMPTLGKNLATDETLLVRSRLKSHFKLGLLD